MALRTYDEFIARIAAGYGKWQPIWGDTYAATSTNVLSGAGCTIQRCGDTPVMPTLPSGVTAYIPSRVVLASSGVGTPTTLLVCKVINLGSLDISGASGTFTDGSVMPTVTELGVSRTVSSAVIVEVTTALNSAPGSFTVNYLDQDGNASVTTSVALTASALVRSCSLLILATGDWGVQDITAAARTVGTTPTGVLKFWGIIPLTMMPGSPANGGVPVLDSLLSMSFNPVRLGAGDTIMCFIISGSSTTQKVVVGDMFIIGDN